MIPQVKLRKSAARETRILKAADRMLDAIKTAQRLRIPLPVWLVAAADAYDYAMSDPEAEALDTGE